MTKKLTPGEAARAAWEHELCQINTRRQRTENWDAIAQAAIEAVDGFVPYARYRELNESHDAADRRVGEVQAENERLRKRVAELEAKEVALRDLIEACLRNCDRRTLDNLAAVTQNRDLLVDK